MLRIVQAEEVTKLFRFIVFSTERDRRTMTLMDFY